MRLLLDTNVISDLNKPRPIPAVVRFFENRLEADLFISTLVVAESWAGIDRLPPQDPRRASLGEALDRKVLTRFAGRILPIDLPVARAWGRLAADATARRLEFRTIDALIAATAIAHDLSVVTRNVRHFEPYGVRVLNPWEA